MSALISKISYEEASSMHRDGNAAQECRCCCSDAHSHPSIVEAELPEAVLPSHAESPCQWNAVYHQLAQEFEPASFF